MTLNEMAAQSHQTAREKGWYNNGTGPTSLEKHMLMVSEIAEATEEVRGKKPAFYLKHPDERVNPEDLAADMKWGEGSLGLSVQALSAMHPLLKPEGEASELADVLIRIGDYFAAAGWDLDAVVRAKMDYNKTRPHRHGGKAL